MRLSRAALVASFLVAAPARADDPWNRDVMLRAGLGSGAFANGASIATYDRGDSFVREGPAIAGELLLGGRIVPRVHFGGGIAAMVLPEGPRSAGNAATVTFTLIGPFADWNCYEGFHVEALVGLGSLNDGNSPLVPTGIGLGGGLGWETPVSTKWTIGLLARADSTALEASSASRVEHHRVLNGALLVTGTFHLE